MNDMNEDNQAVQQSAPAAGGGSNKMTYLIVAIVVIVVVGWLAKGAFRAATGVNINTSLGGSTTYSNSQGTVNVGGNTLPDNWPSDAPKYPNASIQYSGSSNPQTGEKGAAVVFTTTDSLQAVVDFYKKELASGGWTVEQTANIGANSVISAKKDTRTFGAYIADTGNGQRTVTIGIGIPNAQ